MPTEIDDSTCPKCGWPAALVYDRLRNGEGKVKAEYLEQVRCTNPDCFGANG